MKRFFLVFIFLLVSVPCFADRMTIPPNTQWGLIRDTYIHPMFTELYNALGANESGELPGTVTFDGLIVLGDGDSWVQLANNATITDPITGLYLYTFLGGNPTVALNGELKRLALYEELGGGSAPTIQSADPTIADATGEYIATTSGDRFYVVHGVGVQTIAGTWTGDTDDPVLVAGADGTHDGSTPVTATMVLTELYPDPSTLLYTVTGGTPASGTWTGTYPNYSVEITPTGTDDIVVTSSASDLAGNAATGTDLAQEFAHSGGSSCDTPVYSNNATVVNSFPIGHYNYYHVGMSYNSGSPHTICSVTANMSYDYTGNASNNTYVMRIYTNSAGNLGSLVASSEGVIGSNAWNNTPVEFIFGTPPSLSANTAYWVVCNMGAAETSNIVTITTSAHNGTNSVHFFNSSGAYISSSATTPNMTIKE